MSSLHNRLAVAPHDSRKKIAVIGSGIAGLSAAWLLSYRHDVTLLEKEARLGGHSNTAHVPCREGTVPVDTGFIVYNERNYPNLTAFFEFLGVATQSSNMSFSASLDGGDFEYTGSIQGLFADRRNLVRPRMWRLLADVPKLYARASKMTDRQDLATMPLGDFLREERFSAPLRDDHLLPMCAAIWSLPRETVERLPTLSFLRFFQNHGLFSFTDRPKWRTVTQGSQAYVEKLRAAFAGDVVLGNGACGLTRHDDHVEIRLQDGSTRTFDDVVLACHSDEALGLLSDANERERALLGAMPYQRNVVYLHKDEGLMPKRRQVWASWNYLGGETGEPVCVTYWMNRLQSLPTEEQIFVTLNPAKEPRADSIVARYDYDHPVFDTQALVAQSALWELQGQRRTWFAGAYFGSGFHEDGLQAGLAVAERLGGVTRPWRVEDASARIHLAPAAESSQPSLVAAE